MQVHTHDSLAVHDAIDDFEIATRPLRLHWSAQREGEKLAALDTVIDVGGLLADQLVRHGRCDGLVIGIARQLYFGALSVLRVLDGCASSPLVEEAQLACLDFLDVPAGIGYGVTHRPAHVEPAHWH